MKKALIVLLFCLFFIPYTIKAETFTVINTNDSGAGSLRQAVKDANAIESNDIINISIPTTDQRCTASGICTITLTGGELTIISAATAGTLEITNPTGANNLIISGNNYRRIFLVTSYADLTLGGITITKGSQVDGGGGILNEPGGSLTLINSIVTRNSARFGGGIYNAWASATLINSTVSQNDSSGIRNENGYLSLINSTVTGNTTTSGGGGIINYNGNLLLTRSTISGNSARFGGGIHNQGNLWAASSTISGNAAELGGAILQEFGTFDLVNVTVAYNRVATPSNCPPCVGGIYNSSAQPIKLNNTIVAKNGTDIFGEVSPGSYFNLIGSNRDTSGITNGENRNQVGTPLSPIDPRLMPLANNGGTTETHALMLDSPALDKGYSFDATADQRGLTRPVDIGNFPNAFAGADIGAFEMQLPTVASVTISGRVISSNRGIINARVYLTNQNGETKTALTNSLGYYTFDDVRAGESYTVTVSSKRYQFSPQIVSVNGEMTDLDFIAQP